MKPKPRRPPSSGISLSWTDPAEGHPCKFQVHRRFLGTSSQFVECGTPAVIILRIMSDNGDETKPCDVLSEIPLCRQHVGAVAKDCIGLLTKLQPPSQTVVDS